MYFGYNSLMTQSSDPVAFSLVFISRVFKYIMQYDCFIKLNKALYMYMSTGLIFLLTFTWMVTQYDEVKLLFKLFIIIICLLK